MGDYYEIGQVGQPLVDKMNADHNTLADKAAATHTHDGGDPVLVERISGAPSATGYVILSIDTVNKILRVADTDGSVTGFSLPGNIDSGDAGKIAKVKDDGSGWELGESLPDQLRLNDWQTDPAEFQVEVQDAFDTDGHGKDLLPHHVFPAGANAIMYHSLIVPFSGYDLRFNAQYRMSTSVSGDVVWKLAYKAVSPGDARAEVSDDSGFGADATLSLTDTPSATANLVNAISGTDLVIPASAYAAGDRIELMFYRDGDDASDTHTGNAEMADCIFLEPANAA